MDLAEQNVLLSLHASMSRVGEIDLDVPPRTDQPRPVDLSVMMADTNVVSRLMRDAQIRWCSIEQRGIAPSDLTICVVTMRRSSGDWGNFAERERELERRWSRLVDDFAESIAIYEA